MSDHRMRIERRSGAVHRQLDRLDQHAPDDHDPRKPRRGSPMPPEIKHRRADHQQADRRRRAPDNVEEQSRLGRKGTRGPR